MYKCITKTNKKFYVKKKKRFPGALPGDGKARTHKKEETIQLICFPMLSLIFLSSSAVSSFTVAK